MFSAFCLFGLLNLFHLCSPVFGQTFPTDIQQCKLGDTDCLRTVMNSVIHKYPEGYKELELIPFDPLKLDKFSIVQSEQSPVNIRLHLRNITLTGLKDVDVKKVVGFGDLKTSKFEVIGKTKKLQILGDYKLNGQVLILPITGNGFANLTFENANIHIKVFPKAETREGKEYAIIDRVRAKFTTTKFHLHFTNLFNDKRLSDNMNLFLQQNSDEIFKEVKTSIENAVSEVVQMMLIGPFKKFAYRDLYLP